jgi:pimeloyl-ACP methyl ester carboxylesterase
MTLGYSALGPLKFNETWVRDDFTLTNARHERIHGSWWRHHRGSRATTVLLYLHGNSSSRVEALRCGALETAVGLSAELVAFDFAGSGWSGGEVVGMGLLEVSDLADVVAFVDDEFARKRGQKEPTIALWGRAMGATAVSSYEQ